MSLDKYQPHNLLAIRYTNRQLAMFRRQAEKAGMEGIAELIAAAMLVKDSSRVLAGGLEG